MDISAFTCLGLSTPEDLMKSNACLTAQTGCEGNKQKFRPIYLKHYNGVAAGHVIFQSDRQLWCI